MFSTGYLSVVEVGFSNRDVNSIPIITGNKVAKPSNRTAPESLRNDE